MTGRRSDKKKNGGVDVMIDPECNGDSIYVNLDWRQDGYAIAYQNGVYGYVDAKYINW